MGRFGIDAPESHVSYRRAAENIEVPAGWVLLHEVGPYGNDHSMHLEANPAVGVYRVESPPANEAVGHGDTLASSPLPWALPWLMIVGLAGIAEAQRVFRFAIPQRRVSPLTPARKASAGSLGITPAALITGRRRNPATSCTSARSGAPNAPSSNS